jgi:hypothetical protein
MEIIVVKRWGANAERERERERGCLKKSKGLVRRLVGPDLFLCFEPFFNPKGKDVL